MSRPYIENEDYDYLDKLLDYSDDRKDDDNE